MIGIGMGMVTGGGKGAPFNRWALSFNGTDEYLTRALPTNILTGTVNDWSSAGTLPSGWVAGNADFQDTTAGKTGTYAVKLPEGAIIPGFVIGQKYKLKMRYICIGGGCFVDDTSFIESATWNTAYKTFTATATTVAIVSQVDLYIDVLNFTPDWKLDLNEQYELIKHSDNRNFAGASVTYETNGNQAFSSGSGVGLITSTGVGDATTNYVGLPDTEMETLEVGKKYTLEASLKTDPASLVYGSDLFSSAVNSGTNPFETFITSGNDITSAINTADLGIITINIGSVTAGEIVKVTLNLTLNSGTVPRISLTGGTLRNTIAGTNTYYFVADSTLNPTYLEIREPSAAATNFSMTDIVITKATPITHTFKIGTKTVTITPSITATYSKSVLNFLWEAADATAGQELKQYLSGTGVVTFDNVSLTQAYDYWVGYKLKNTGAMVGTEQYYLMVSKNVADIGMGFEQLLRTNANGILTKIGDGTYSAQKSPVSSKVSELTDGTFDNLSFLYNRTGDSYVRLNSSGDTFSSTALGKVVLTNAIAIGQDRGGSLRFTGLIGAIQIIRFSNIAGSNFDVTNYRAGQQITGGGAKVVLWIDPRLGSSVANMLQDYSGAGNNLTAVNIDTTNRVRITT